jgi:hypothetical protein
MSFVHEPNIRVNVNGPVYNSTLWIRNISNRLNADLALKINVQFVKIDNANNLRGLTRGPNPLPPIVPWGAEWNGWKQQALRFVNEYWNNKLYLVPQGFCGLDWRVSLGNVYRPNFRCGLVVREAGSPHIRIGCVKVPPNGPHTSFWLRRSKILWLDNRDTALQNKVGGQQQRPIIHEFGHVLGLSHVGANSQACLSAQDGNATVCYGSAGSYQAGDVMGTGMRLDGWHSWPWKNRLKQHLHRIHRDVAMNAVLRRPAPRRLFSYEMHEPSSHRLSGGVGASSRDGGV